MQYKELTICEDLQRGDVYVCSDDIYFALTLKTEKDDEKFVYVRKKGGICIETRGINYVVTQNEYFRKLVR